MTIPIAEQIKAVRYAEREIAALLEAGADVSDVLRGLRAVLASLGAMQAALAVTDHNRKTAPGWTHLSSPETIEAARMALARRVGCVPMGCESCTCLGDVQAVLAAIVEAAT